MRIPISMISMIKATLFCLHSVTGARKSGLKVQKVMPASHSLGSVAKSTRKSTEELEFELLIEDAKNRKEHEEGELRVQARLEAKLAVKRAAQGAGVADAKAEGVEQQTERDSRGFFRFGRRSKSESSAKRRKESPIDEGVQVTEEALNTTVALWVK